MLTQIVVAFLTIPCLAAVADVTATDMSNACRNVRGFDDPSAPGKTIRCKVARPHVADFCAVFAPLTDSPSTEYWNAWKEVSPPTPTPTEVAEAAACETESVKKDMLFVPAGDAGPAVLGPGATAGAVGSSQSAILWGLSDFLVDRAKLELEIWSVENLKKTLCAPLNTEEKKKGKVSIGAFFPNACSVLTSYGTDGLSESAYVLLRSAFRVDLNALPVSMARQLSAKAETAEARDAILASGLAGSITVKILGGEPPTAALVSRPPQELAELVNCETTPVSRDTLYLTALLRSFSSGDSVSFPFISQAGGSSPATGVLDRKAVQWGLMALSVNVGADGDYPWPSCSARKVNAEALFSAANRLGAVYGSLRSLKQALEALSQLEQDPKATDAQKVKAYALVVRNVAGIVSAALPPDCRTPACEKRALIVHGVGSVASAIAEGNYGQATMDLVVSLDGTLPADVLPKEFVRLSSFAVEVGQAKDASSAKTAFENFAAPVGSYRQKRTASHATFSLNAYVGLTGGYESAGGSNGWVYGPIAAVGPEVVFSPKPIGLFVQLIDIGALASFSAGNSAVDSRPEVGWQQVFAPGLFLIFPIKGAPFTIGAGVSKAAKLRSLSGSNPPTQVDASRLSAFVAIDLPLFP